MREKYTIGIRESFICYFKDGILHREAGPALFKIEDKEKYFHLEDKNLYKDELIFGTPDFKWAELFKIMLDNPDKQPAYYLEGEKYEEVRWKSIVENKKLHKDLIAELPKSEENNKKPKI